MRYLFVCMALLLAACGGGGGSSGSADNNQNATPPADAKPGGFYTGSFTSDFSGDAVSVGAVVLETGETIMLSEYGIYTAQLDPDGTAVDAEFEAFALWGSTWDGVNTYLHGNIEGTISERSGINGEYTLGSDSGTFALTYDDEYEENSSLAKTAGTWGYSIPEFSYAISVAIDGSGNINGQDSDGCIYRGDIATVDTDYNAYRMTGVSIDCPSGSVTGGIGMAYITRDDQNREILAFGVQFTQKLAVIDFFYKQ